MSYSGLTSLEAKTKLEQFGFNEIKEKKHSAYLKFFHWLISPIALMLSTAALLSLFIGKDFDFYFILILMLINFFVGFWQEKKADNAISNLSQKLAVQVKVLRDDAWKLLEAREVVPGDIIELSMGDMVPADIEILEAKNLNINEAALTGESLPKDKAEREECYSGSFVTLGWGRAKVKATGEKTYFGKILISIDKTPQKSLLEKDILSISKLLTFLSLGAVIILSVVFILKGKSFAELLTLDLSLIIAGIPISLPTVMTLIISFGVLGLAKKNTIVRRLSSLEDLANVDLLLSDKTGTLTKNEISIEKIIPYNNYSDEEVVTFASFTTSENDRNPINQIIRKKTLSLNLDTTHEIIDFIPFDSVRKRSTAIVIFKDHKMSVRTGAPQIIEAFCELDSESKTKFEKEISQAARMGYRAVAIAVKEYEKEEAHMKLVGVLLFSDTLEKGVQKTIKFIKDNGIKIKMLSGDNIAIAERIAQELKLQGTVINKEIIHKEFKDLTKEEFEKIGVFAEIFPADKYDLVKLAEKNYTVAVTGDGVNDLPALKAANVSIAVKNAVDSLKSVADITLMSSGITVIKDAIIESRKIFARLYSYSVYRISESFRVIVTIAVLGTIYGTYPMEPIQLILLAFLNDLPIISLAFNRVRIATVPSKINIKERMTLSILFGMVGVVNSLLFVIITKNIFHLDWVYIQTLFFLKLTVSGHMLIFVAHTKERWYKYLPSKVVIWATLITQAIATLVALTGILMQKVSWELVIFVWLWAAFWMQISDLMKGTKRKVKTCNLRKNML